MDSATYIAYAAEICGPVAERFSAIHYRYGPAPVSRMPGLRHAPWRGNVSGDAGWDYISHFAQFSGLKWQVLFKKMKAPGHCPRLSLQPPTKPNALTLAAFLGSANFIFSL